MSKEYWHKNKVAILLHIIALLICVIIGEETGQTFREANASYSVRR